MQKSNGDIIREKFPLHQFDITLNEDGYSDIEIIIDDKYSGIWIDDWEWFESNKDDLDSLIEQIEEYLFSIKS